MQQVSQPGKEQVREWLQQRRASPLPPPNLEQIRRELGWALPKQPSAPA